MALIQLREVELIPGRKWRFDFYFQEKDLAVEIEGALQCTEKVAIRKGRDLKKMQEI
jgi:hypothetical protein